MLVFTPLTDAIVAEWGTDHRASRGVVVAMVAAVAAGAIWKIFHSVARARLLFVTGLLVGALLVVRG